MGKNKIKINRAPVLTLWAVVVAQRLGYDRAAALTLGKSVAGLNAQSKGQRLGIYHPREATPEEKKKRKQGEEFEVQILGRAVPALETEGGIRAAIKGKAIPPESVERYLQQKFREDLPDVEGAMKELARSFKPQELAARAYLLYEGFRPEIPEGTRGWGAQGELDLDKIRSLAHK
ncbi:MAG TPA: hypothetical protein VF932_08120 [Anaerolineae bacterium]